jgi:hypothetical protein
MPLQRVGMVRSVGYNVTIKRLGLKCSHGTNTLAYLGAGSMHGHNLYRLLQRDTHSSSLYFICGAGCPPTLLVTRMGCLTNITTLSVTVKYTALTTTLCLVSFMLTVAFKPIMPSVIILSVIILRVTAPTVCLFKCMSMNQCTQSSRSKGISETKSKQLSPCSSCMHQPVMSWGNACRGCIFSHVRPSFE